eukprot:CAMPEP_0204026682 /NCGR_PEP_ID=MMETSP0360-20130528/47120_1 /ASSEMBLY_ACC=CAM_ASM_000342 /TAXON_ID=268821 /ORGANISM="Scrippsiella Hangoei, Strain SHTV-5" /LENGTH=45 /DNA_ID= /DNA_START= /DNA_END= /DNA_ORIENTATION=
MPPSVYMGQDGRSSAESPSIPEGLPKMFGVVPRRYPTATAASNTA